MSSRVLLRAYGKLKEHFYLLPLVGVCSFSASIGIFTSVYTTMRKTDVIVNRWADKLPEERVDWTKPTQKLVMTNSTEYAGYKPRPAEVEKLYQLIYANGDYKIR